MAGLEDGLEVLEILASDDIFVEADSFVKLYIGEGIRSWLVNPHEFVGSAEKLVVHCS